MTTDTSNIGSVSWRYHEIAVYGTYKAFYLVEHRMSRTKCQSGSIFVSDEMRQVLVGVHPHRALVPSQLVIDFGCNKYEFSSMVTPWGVEHNFNSFQLKSCPFCSY